jgi:pimeloyl-ACP methyl ester carboxylesterase
MGERQRATKPTGTTAGADIRPFRVEVPESDLKELRQRLALTRWPHELPDVGWSRGVALGYLKTLAEYWRTGYDWRAHEARLNEVPQFTTKIDGQTIHFLHVRSGATGAMPLLLIHGWPGSIVEFLDVIGPLSDPRRHGAPSAVPFDLVIPSIPGHGFSSPLDQSGWTINRIAKAFTELMARLGYDRYGVQGGDHGALIAPEMGRLSPDKIFGVHVNAWLGFPSGAPGEFDGLSAVEQKRLGRIKEFQTEGMGYIHIQGTRPQTLAYGLTDSPAGQLAWIVEKFKEWTDSTTGVPEDAVDRDRILTDVSIYWFTRTAGSAANLYYEMAHDAATWRPKIPGTVPFGVAVFAGHDIAIRRFAERDENVVHWTEIDSGGHFAALEQPKAFTNDVRDFFGKVR